MAGGVVYSLVIITVAVTIAMILLPDDKSSTETVVEAPSPTTVKPAPSPAAVKKAKPKGPKKRRASEASASVAGTPPPVATAGGATVTAAPVIELTSAPISWFALDGVAVDEGTTVTGPHRSCDLDCCKAKCEAHELCHSISHRSDRQICYLKDACLDASTAVKAGKFYSSYALLACGDASGRAAAVDDEDFSFIESTSYIRGPLEWMNHPAVQTMHTGSESCATPRCGSGSTDLGTWVHPQVFQPFKCWRPLYSTEDAATCLAGKKIALLGDSLSRFMYWCLAYTITGEAEYETNCRNYVKSQKDMGPIELKPPAPAHGTKVTSADGSVVLEFLWLPSIAGSAFKGNPISAAQEMQAKLEDIFTSGKYDVIIGNIGLWDMLHTEIAAPRMETGLLQLQRRLDNLAMEGKTKIPEVVWMTVQSVVEHKTNPRRSNDDIIEWNKNVSNILLKPGDRSGRYFFKWLDGFEMTITAAPDRTLRDDGRHFFSNIVLQVVNAALNLVCPLPGGSMGESGAFFKPFAHTPCTERVLPEVHNERLTRGLISNYLQSDWMLVNDTRSPEEIKAELYGPNNLYEAKQPLFAHNGVPIVIKGGPDILDLSQAFSTPEQRLNWVRDTAPMQTVGVRGYPAGKSHVRMKKYIDEIMPTSPKTTMQFSGNVGNSKISEASFRALGLKIPRWFAAEEYEKPAGSTQASLWMSHAGGTTPMHRDHIHNGNIAQPVVGRKTWFLLPPWVGPWACVVHNNISKVGFSKARHPGHREYWEEVCPSLANVIDSMIVIRDFDPPDGLFIPGGWYHAVEHQEKSVMINFWIKHPEYQPIKWKE